MLHLVLLSRMLLRSVGLRRSRDTLLLLRSRLLLLLRLPLAFSAVALAPVAALSLTLRILLLLGSRLLLLLRLTLRVLLLRVRLLLLLRLALLILLLRPCLLLLLRLALCVLLLLAGGRQTRSYRLRGVQLGWLRSRHHRRLSIIGGSKLRAIAPCSLLVFSLRGNFCYMLLMLGCQLCGCGARLDTIWPAVVADAVHRNVVYHRLVVHVAYALRIDVIDGAVVVKLPTLPAASVIAIARISIAVINAAVEPNRRSPITRVPIVLGIGKAPVARRPKIAGLGSHYPRSGNPEVLVIIGTPCPIARHPDVTGSGKRWLGIHR